MQSSEPQILGHIRMDHCDHMDEKSPGEGTFSLSFVTDQQVNLHYAFHCNAEEKRRTLQYLKTTILWDSWKSTVNYLRF